MELVEEQRSGRWYVRYKDDFDDPWHREGPFASDAQARQWLADNPVVEAGDNDGQG